MARILIVEDEADQAELFRMALEAAGHSVAGADEDLPKAAGTVDLVILDEWLGWRSGSALIPAVRARFPRAKILMLSADPEAAENALQRGADAGRMKPLPLGQLIALVETLLREAKPGPERDG